MTKFKAGQVYVYKSEEQMLLYEGIMALPPAKQRAVIEIAHDLAVGTWAACGLDRDEEREQQYAWSRGWIEQFGAATS